MAVAQILSSLGSKVYNFDFGMKVGGSGEVPAFAGTTGLGLSFIPVFTAVLSGVKNLKFWWEINFPTGNNPRFFTAFRMAVVGVRDDSGGRSGDGVSRGKGLLASFVCRISQDLQRIWLVLLWDRVQILVVGGVGMGASTPILTFPLNGRRDCFGGSLNFPNG